MQLCQGSRWINLFVYKKNVYAYQHKEILLKNVVISSRLTLAYHGSLLDLVMTAGANVWGWFSLLLTLV